VTWKAWIWIHLLQKGLDLDPDPNVEFTEPQHCKKPTHFWNLNFYCWASKNVFSVRLELCVTNCMSKRLHPLTDYCYQECWAATNLKEMHRVPGATHRGSEKVFVDKDANLLNLLKNYNKIMPHSFLKRVSQINSCKKKVS